MNRRKVKGDKNPLLTKLSDFTLRSFSLMPKDSNDLKNAYKDFKSNDNKNYKVNTVFNNCNKYNNDVTDDTEFKTELINKSNINYNIILKSAKIPNINKIKARINLSLQTKTLCYKDITL